MTSSWSRLLLWWCFVSVVCIGFCKVWLFVYYFRFSVKVWHATMPSRLVAMSTMSTMSSTTNAPMRLTGDNDPFSSATTAANRTLFETALKRNKFQCRLCKSMQSLSDINI